MSLCLTIYLWKVLHTCSTANCHDSFVIWISCCGFSKWWKQDKMHAAVEIYGFHLWINFTKRLHIYKLCANVCTFINCKRSNLKNYFNKNQFYEETTSVDRHHPVGFRLREKRRPIAPTLNWLLQNGKLMVTAAKIRHYDWECSNHMLH